MNQSRTASQEILDAMDAVLSTRAKAAAVLRTAVEVCGFPEDKGLIGADGILKIASELDNGSPVR